MASKWRIQLLGGLRAVHGDVVLRRFPSQKAASLIALLAIGLGRSVAREELIDALWPGEDLGTARPRLSRLLNVVRNLFDPILPDRNSVVATQGHRTVELDENWAITDVTEFEALAGFGAGRTGPEQFESLRRANRLYTGELLPGFYEERIENERLRLSDLYGSVLTRLASLAEQEGELEEATVACSKLVSLDPLQEENHLSLIRLYGLKGQTSHAIAQYERLERMLREHFDEPPSLATRTLIDRIRSRKFALRTGLDLPRRPAASTVTIRPSRELAADSTLFFGREPELNQAARLLLGPARLVTLVGLGGAGKTRLAKQVAMRLLDDFQGAVWFTSLTEISSPDDIAITILRNLDLPPVPEASVMETLVTSLRRTESCLLLLDNFEHLVARSGSDVVIELLHRVAGCKLLVTSIQSLGVAGEHVMAVDPLSTPAARQAPDELMKYASIRLYVDRASAVNPRFRFGEENAEDVRALCAKLEGIPLAIELAAAHADVLSPRETLDGISQRFDLLVRRDDHPSSRHRSLRSAIEHGLSLLSPRDRSFFARLSTFEGGWTLDAARFVADEPQAEDSLTALRDRSLVRWEGGRYGMLETIREFAWNGQSRKEQERLEARRAEFYLQLAQEAAKHSGSAAQAHWVNALGADHENLISALRWWLDTGQVETGLRMAISLVWHWQAVGPLWEGRDWLSRFLEGPASGLSVELQAAGLGSLGQIAWRQGDFPFAKATHERCLSIRRLIGDRAGIARSLYDLGIAHFRMGSYDETKKLMEESLAISTLLDDPAGVSRATLNLGNVATEQGDYAASKRLFEQCVRLERSIGNLDRASGAINNLGFLAYSQKRYVLAIHYYEECLRMAEAQGATIPILMPLMNLGAAYGRIGQWDRAVKLIGDAMESAEVVADGHQLLVGLYVLARLAAVAGFTSWAVLFLGGAEDLANRTLAKVQISDEDHKIEAEELILTELSPDEYRVAVEAGHTQGWQSVVSQAKAWANSVALSK